MRFRGTRFGRMLALLALPLLASSARTGLKTFESPREFVPAIRAVVACYMAAVVLFGAGILVGK